MARTRAYRRTKLALKKKNCSRYYVAGYWGVEGVPQTDKKIVGKVAAATKSCDGWCCNKPRKNHGELFSDVRNKQRYVDQE
ncbi:hypothetical protein AH04_44 [Erwinia phage AH04]|uniref:Uncharacterized protein n=1 Tax=Erwinia phage AH04 TaxID=2869569 RepID=A0AAE8BQ17_9CAUD|nr:hypothetical protein PQC02_gp270 [Erwinia phage AH04]QZA70529.1 hypothetical protein AH04_44 [Erwinia phage AH04]